MKEKNITLAELVLIGGTRFLAGVGAGLLLADKIRPGGRKQIGGILLAIGVLSTIPIAYGIVYPKIIKGEANEKQIIE